MKMAFLWSWLASVLRRLGWRREVGMVIECWSVGPRSPEYPDEQESRED